MTIDSCTPHSYEDCIGSPNCFYWSEAKICTEIPEPPTCTKKALAMYVGDSYTDPYNGNISYTKVDPTCDALHPLANISIRTPWGTTHNITVRDVSFVRYGEYFIFENGPYRYAAVIKFMCGAETAPITVTTCYWEQICPDYISENECVSGGCHWWSDNSCRDYPEPPPQATGSVGLIIKPNSWYRGNLEQAVIDITAKTGEITANLSKYFNTLTGFELVSIDIYPDMNIDRIILKIYYKELGIQTMVAPIVLAQLVLGFIVGVFVVIALVGWIESWFIEDDIDHPTVVPIDEIIDAGQGGIDGAGDSAAGNIYDIPDALAKALNDCLDVAETIEDVEECYGVAEIPVENQTDANAESLGIARWTAALAVLYTLCEALSNNEYCQKADELDNTLGAALSDFRAGTISAEEFLLTVSSEINQVQDFLEVKEEEAEKAIEEEAKKDCFIVNPGYPITSDNPCIITNNQAMIGAAIIGLGIVGIYILKKR